MKGEDMIWFLRAEWVREGLHDFYVRAWDPDGDKSFTTG